MERLEEKVIHGQTYYYYSKWGWKNGKCRRLWQRYLGKLSDIANAVDSGGPPPAYAEVFRWGLPMALWQEAKRALVADEIAALCPKREQGLAIGDYLSIAAINRAISPRSKRSLWDWFSKTSLLRCYPQASASTLSSQRFWDHMDRIASQNCAAIWKKILAGVVAREAIDLSAISYDGTNFYTFIDTFNLRCQLARRGKNKQGRANLRQINYALFCCADGQLPLFYDVYEGNRNDAKQFPMMLQRFAQFMESMQASGRRHITLVFDKGNNSTENFALLDKLSLSYVGSVKLDEHKELAQISNDSPSFAACHLAGLEGTKALRLEKEVYGRRRTLVVSYNQNLFHTQWLTVQNDIIKAMETLSALHQKIQDRTLGLIKGGQAPSLESVERQSASALNRPHLKQIIHVNVHQDKDAMATLDYALDMDALHKISNTYLGKNILITDRQDWSNDQIIQAYRSQFIIENVFKEMKDRCLGSWWPLHHWTDSKIQVHGLYCTIALLLRALLLRRLHRAGLQLSLKRAFAELDDLREVVNVFSRKRGQKRQRMQTVLSKASELQQQITSALGLNTAERNLLG